MECVRWKKAPTILGHLHWLEAFWTQNIRKKRKSKCIWYEVSLHLWAVRLANAKKIHFSEFGK
jgi:hypothetical protein